MSNESASYAQRVHDQFMKERDGLIDAARESSRTFAKAVLTFGSAVFGASVAFLKDVASKPAPCSLVSLGIAWGCFTLGLLAVLLSFIFSHKACIARIDECAEQMKNPNSKPSPDLWGGLTATCNYLCILFLFSGIVSWIVFAIQNLAITGGR